MGKEKGGGRVMHESEIATNVVEAVIGCDISFDMKDGIVRAVNGLTDP